MTEPGTTKQSKPWLYFGLTYLFSWAFTVPAALVGADLDDAPGWMAVYALGGLGPAIAAILLVYLTMDPEGRRDYWRRIIDPRRIAAKWYAVIFLLVPAVTGLSGMVDWLLGGPGIELELATRLLEQPLSILPLVLFYLLFGPVPEEVGWRGYALDGLQRDWSALVASLVLGVAWALWHLPQFFIKGTYQYELGFGSWDFWLFMLQIVVISVLYTWIYNNTARSTLSAILFHFMVNFTGELFSLSARAEVFYFAITVLLVALVVLVWGAKTLTKGQAYDGEEAMAIRQ